MRNFLSTGSLAKGMAILLVLFSLVQCKKKSDQAFRIDPAFTEKITAFTSGTISSESVIQILLAEDCPDPVELNTAIETKLFDFKPEIKGNAFWTDKRTIEFRPDENLKSGETYKARFFLSKVMKVPSSLKIFEFQFSVIPQSFRVSIEGFESYSNDDLQWNKIKGSLIAADVIDLEHLMKIISAKQSDRTFSIKWAPPQDSRTFAFTIDSVRRSEKAEMVEISWDGSAIGFSSKGKQELEMPALGDFKVMDVKVAQQPDQFLQIRFSDPVKKGQNLEGMIYLENYTSLTYQIEGNTIKAYPAARQGGNVKLYIHKGIRNVQGYEMKEDFSREIAFEIPKPAVRLAGKGVILPASQGLIFPFEAVNLNAVDVRIIKIFENNIGHFLQVNQLEGNNQLKRAGRLIHKEKVQLNHNPVDLGNWNMFYLDLARFIKPDPGSIYRIEIQFRKSYSLYPCEGPVNEVEEDTGENQDEMDDAEVSYWDSYEEYYEEYYDEDFYEDYNWDERDNPCSKSYYSQNRFVARNILASDLGIIAKGGNANSLLVSVTNLVTAQAIGGAEITILNYQQQPVANAVTNNNGMANLVCNEKPFLLIAKKDNQRGYLRLDDGSSLSLSQFDVSGQVVQKGLKGFIYGERGVWRPGDTLFLTFLLEDKQKSLPENHPVILELYNPQGQIYTRINKRTGSNGFYTFAAPTRPDDPTGYWNAKIKVGGTEFSKTLKIETIKPNRLKMTIGFGVDKLTVNDKALLGDLAVTWLHGAPARNLKAKVDVTFTQNETSFSKYPDYKFTDPSRTFTSEEQTIFDGRINEEGKARISAALSVEQRSPGMLKANLLTRVFEESGDFSTDFFSLPYSPYSSYVGIRTPEGDKRGMLLTDTTQWVDVVTVDNDGNPVNRADLEVNIYKINWRSWWESSTDDLAEYIGNNYNQPLVTKKVSTTNGKGRFSFRINRPEWGRFFIRVLDPVSGHATGKIVYIDWPGWAGRPLRNDPQTATMLTFNSDKTTYRVGEKAEITIPTSNQGHALITIESGSSVLHSEWIEASDKESRYTFTITPEMAPNVYVYVMLIQPHGNTVNDMPIRLYGVIPILVENPETRLQPQISMPEVLEPEKNFTVKVSEVNKKAMTYTLAIVDDGLLDLTRFKTPDPWSIFYAREALGIKTWDLYDQVIGAYSGKLENILSIGGDAEEVRPGEEKANRFKPVVIFKGPFALQPGQTNVHTLSMPRYVGSVRTMVIAGADGAYGSQEKTVPVRSPLMVLATLPRVLGPGEEVKLPVTVFAMERNIKNVTVQIKTNDLLIPQGEKSTTVSFNQIGDKLVTFSLKTAQKIGLGKVTVIAKSDNRSATYDIELDVRPSNPKVTVFQAGVIDAGKSWLTEFELPGMPGTNTGVLEVSSIPPIDIERRLHYLIAYPHGCIEQTTSSVFPQLYLMDIMDLDNNFKAQITNNVKAGIDRLKSFLLSGGGFSFWPGENSISDWGSSYAGHFMLEAEKKGYALPVGLKSGWLKYQKKAARQWRNGTSNNSYEQYDLEQAYRLFTLALAGEPEMGAMNRLREEKALSLQALWRLAAAYALAGQTETAKQLTERAGTDIQPYKGSSSSYGSAERDWAMILETLMLLNERTKAAPVALKISEKLSTEYWMSTQTTAYCLLSMAKFAGASGTSKNLAYSYRLNESKTLQANTTKPVSKVTLNLPSAATAGKILLENRGQGLLYARVILSGTPASGNEKSSESNMTLKVDYRNIDGSLLDASRINQGSDFLVQVTVHNSSPAYYKDMALTQIFPSGWEIRNSRLYDFLSPQEISIPAYQDIRDDRVLTYFDLRSGQSKTFVIPLNASYLGRFYLPGVICEAMYDNSIFAIKEGKWIEVVSN
jgi:alpha-2-macroglobulin